MKKKKFYKVLKDGGSCCKGGIGQWGLPAKNDDGTWAPGAWMPKIKGKLKPCSNGYHICCRSNLISWLDEAIFEVEYRGSIIVKDSKKSVVREARLLRKIETWDEKTARLFAADCAEKVLPIYEEKYPDDDRPRKAVKVARDYANGKIKKAAMAVVCSAAYSAAHSAAHSGAHSGVYSAAYSAAESAAHSGVYSAAYSAAESAADSAAYSAARKWQTNLLFKYLDE